MSYLWNQNPYLTNPYVQQGLMVPQQPVPLAQAPLGSTKVDGVTEAMNRFLMHYPANMLVPGFISDALFDIDGKHFYSLSIEADGRRNLERFRYEPDQEGQVTNTDFISRREFEEFAAKVNAVIGANDGIHGPVQPAATAVGEQAL